MLKKLLKLFSFFKKKEGASLSLSMSFNMEVTMKSPLVEPPTPPPKGGEKTNIVPFHKESTSKALDIHKMSYAEEIFLINVSHYQLGYLNESSVNVKENLILYFAGGEICATYRGDNKKWEVFYNSHLWDHTLEVTSYDIEREKYKYLTSKLEIRRVPYLMVRDLNQMLDLIKTDFVSKDGQRVEEVKQISWENWKELIPA